MVDDDELPPVACTLTEEELADRPEAVQQILVSHYLGAEERDDGYTFRFQGAGGSVLAVASFVANELQCCSFANYTIDVSPPYEETQLTITGPEGTKVLFADLVNRLQAESA